jgi:hypothetical protein
MSRGGQREKEKACHHKACDKGPRRLLLASSTKAVHPCPGVMHVHNVLHAMALCTRAEVMPVQGAAGSHTEQRGNAQTIGPSFFSFLSDFGGDFGGGRWVIPARAATLWFPTTVGAHVPMRFLSAGVWGRGWVGGWRESPSTP